MIVFHIDVMLAKRKMSLTELSERVGITLANLSILKTGKARAVRMETLDRLCPGHPHHHAGRHLPGAGLPAGGPAGVPAGGKGLNPLQIPGF